MNFSSREYLFLAIFLITFFSSCTTIVAASDQHTQITSIQKQLSALENSSGGRIGVFAINTANNRILQYRAQESFPVGCTSKVIGVAAILKQSMTDKKLLQQKINYKKEDLVSWSPTTQKHIAEGMTISELCEAAIVISDNTAMNLLAKKLGGVQQINVFARSLGDNFFRLDHGWPEEAESGGLGNLYDTSTPATMARNLQKLAFGNILALSQRQQLLSWLKNNKTGDARIRAGVPKGWIVGDKTGTGAYYGTTNDIGIIWPPKSAPIILAIYFTQDKKDATKREDIIAKTTRILLSAMAIA